MVASNLALLVSKVLMAAASFSLECFYYSKVLVLNSSNNSLNLPNNYGSTLFPAVI